MTILKDWTINYSYGSQIEKGLIDKLAKEMVQDFKRDNPKLYKQLKFKNKQRKKSGCINLAKIIIPE